MPGKTKISKIDAERIAAAMKDADKGPERKAVVERFMAELNCSERAIYRAARSGGWRSGNRPRADRGSCRLEEEELNILSAMQLASKRKDRHTIMPMETALDIAVSSGLAQPVLSPSRLNQVQRAARMSRRQMECDVDLGPHVNLRSLYPNHVHQVDVTNCVQYFFKEGSAEREARDAGLQHRDMKLEFSVKKPDAWKSIKKRLMRYAIIDHYSGAFFVKYFYASAEKSSDMADFLIEAWGARTPARATAINTYPFRGVPEILICDRGSALMGAIVKSLIEPLGIDHKPHLPGNPRAKGAVEGLMWIWEQHFESRLSVQPAPDLDTLNAWTLDFLVRFNAERKHTRHGATRSAKWLEVPADKLRLLPPDEVCRELLSTRPEERTVKSNLCINYLGSEFRVSNPDLEGRRITVTINPYRWSSERRSVDVAWTDHFGDTHRLEAFEVMRDPASGFRLGEKTAVIGQSFTKHKDTKTQSQMKEFPDLKEMELSAFGDHASRVSPLVHIQPSGSPIRLEPDVPELSETQALLMLREKLGRPLEARETARVEEMGRLTRDDVQKLADEFLKDEVRSMKSEKEDTGA